MPEQPGSTALESIDEIEPEPKDLQTDPGPSEDALASVVTFTPEDEAGLVQLDPDSGVEVTAGYRALQKAIGQIGYRESPAGSNCQAFSRYFGAGCTFWCMYFISWCFDQSDAGNKDRRVAWPAGSASGFYNWAGSGRRVTTPQSGDVVVFRDFSHAGIVRGVNTSTGAFTSVDGNWSDQVIQVSRNYRQAAYYFIRIANGPV